MLSIFSGNLLLAESMCNIIVAEHANSMRARLGFVDFARSGIALAIISVAVSTIPLWFMGPMQFQENSQRRFDKL